MEEDDYPNDHARPLRWYHIPLAIPLLGLGLFVDWTRDVRCKMFGHRPVYGQINYGQCDRCNRPLNEPHVKVRGEP